MKRVDQIPDPHFRRVDPPPEAGKPGPDVLTCSYVATADGLEDLTLVTSRENSDTRRFPIWEYSHPVVGTARTWPEMYDKLERAGLQPD